VNYADCDGDECDGCFQQRPEPIRGQTAKVATFAANAIVAADGRNENLVLCDSSEGATGNDDPIVDLDGMPVHDSFQFCCSLNTTRIYLYDKVCLQSCILPHSN